MYRKPPKMQRWNHEGILVRPRESIHDPGTAPASAKSGKPDEGQYLVIAPFEECPNSNIALCRHGSLSILRTTLRAVGPRFSSSDATKENQYEEITGFGCILVGPAAFR